MKVAVDRADPKKAILSPAQKLQLIVIFGFYLLVGVNSGGFGVILPDFSETYKLGKGDTGLLFVAITAGYLIAALAGSELTARFGLRNFLTGGLFLFGAGSLMMGILPPFGLALLARLILGLAGAVLETGGNFFVAFLPRNTALLNYLHAFFGVGALIGPLVATAVLENHWGWNSLFLIWLGAAGLLSIGFWLTFRGRAISSGSSAVSAPQLESIALAEPKPKRSPMLLALKHPTIWLATIFLLVYVGVETTVGSWSYTYLTEGQHHSNALAGGLVSLYWGGLTVGRFGLGWLAEKAGRQGQDRLLLISCIVISIFGGGLVWLAGEQPLLSGLGLFLIGFSYGPLYPTTLAVLSRIVDSDLVSSAIGLITGLSILGVAVFPWLAGNLMEAGGLATLFPYVTGLGLAMVVLGAILLRPTKKVAA